MGLSSAALYIFSGLPGTGKTTLSRLLARHLGAACLRIDTIEQALRDLCKMEVQAEGYELAGRLASDILKLGVSVVADSCNPLEVTRRAWEHAALGAAARYVNIEVVCSDLQEHRQRVETRPATIPGLRLPTWSQVEQREFQAWTTEHVKIDTAGRPESDCLRELLSRLPDAAVL